MRKVVVLLLLLGLGLVAVGCQVGEKGEAQLETKYCVKCQGYFPLDHPCFQEAPAAEEAAPEALPEAAPETPAAE